jgi:sarcosine oxidase subunit alpha
MLVGRSFKYHRPARHRRLGAEEPNALVNLGEGGRFEPNQRTTTTELFDGLTSTARTTGQALPSTSGVVNNSSRALPAGGFYYKTFIHPALCLETCVRAHRSGSRAGLGKVPSER